MLFSDAVFVVLDCRSTRLTRLHPLYC